MKEIDVSGTRVFIEGAGINTILLIHGWLDTAALWDGQVEALKSQYQCVRFTLPGFDVHEPERKASLQQVVDSSKRLHKR